MEQPLFVVHTLAFEELDRVVDRISLFVDRRVPVPDLFHLLLDPDGELIGHLDAAVHGAVESVAKGELYFDMDRVSLFLHDVPYGLYDHHLSRPHVGIITGAVLRRNKGDHTVFLEPLVQLFHLSVKENEGDRVVVLLLILPDNTLECRSSVILLDRSFDHYGRHRFPPCSELYFDRSLSGRV